jgi:CheY-like chemotaxis protein
MDKPFALIVEDNYEIVTLFQHVLDMAGYHTDIVLDGTEAMQRIEAEPPDIVLLDLQLPGMTGVEILRQMRTNERLSSIPVVVITAYSNYSTRLPFEPDLLLLKPVNIHQLSNLIQRLQSTHGARPGLAHDPITGLYTPAVFAERLTTALERVGQASLLRFGVLFADLLKMEEIRKRMDSREANTLLRRLADQLKGTVRPMDTIAWSPPEGTFLALLEEIPTSQVTLSIAERVQNTLNKHLQGEFASSLATSYPKGKHPTGTQGEGLELRMHCGVLICDTEYKDVEKVMEDVTRARALLGKGTYPSPAVFDHKVVVTNK